LLADISERRPMEKEMNVLKKEVTLFNGKETDAWKRKRRTTKSHIIQGRPIHDIDAVKRKRRMMMMMGGIMRKGKKS
jgi:hypothetical protein